MVIGPTAPDAMGLGESVPWGPAVFIPWLLLCQVTQPLPYGHRPLHPQQRYSSSSWAAEDGTLNIYHAEKRQVAVNKGTHVKKRLFSSGPGWRLAIYC